VATRSSIGETRLIYTQKDVKVPTLNRNRVFPNKLESHSDEKSGESDALESQGRGNATPNSERGP